MAHHFEQTCAYFTAARYMRTVEQVADRIFAPTGLKPAYAYIMMALEDEQPQTVVQLAQRLGYERSSLYRMAQILERQGLLQMTSTGRASSLALLPASAAFLKTANQCLAEFGQYTDTKLGADKVAMTSLLTRNNQKLRSEKHD